MLLKQVNGNLFATLTCSDNVNRVSIKISLRLVEIYINLAQH